MKDKLILNQKEVAELLGVTSQHLLRMAKDHSHAGKSHINGISGD